MFTNRCTGEGGGWDQSGLGRWTRPAQTSTDAAGPRERQTGRCAGAASASPRIPFPALARPPPLPAQRTARHQRALLGVEARLVEVVDAKLASVPLAPVNRRLRRALWACLPGGHVDSIGRQLHSGGRARESRKRKHERLQPDLLQRLRSAKPIRGADSPRPCRRHSRDPGSERAVRSRGRGQVCLVSSQIPRRSP